MATVTRAPANCSSGLHGFVAEELINLDHAWVRCLLAAQHQQLLGEFLCAGARPKDFAETLARASRRLLVLIEQPRVARDDRQQVVEVVRHPPGESTDDLLQSVVVPREFAAQSLSFGTCGGEVGVE